MIEDALKSTRNLHRLILAVSLVTLVFSLSLGGSEDQRAQKMVIDKLIDTNFAAYQTWLDDKVEAAIAQHLPPAVQPLKASLSDNDVLVFNLDRLTDALSRPAHVGQVLVDQLVLSNLSAATLTQLDALNGLSLGHNVQITVPRLSELQGELLLFFEDNPDAGKRIDEIRVDINEFDFTAQSFYPGETITTMLYFELHDAVTVASAPVFQAYFDSDIVELPNTSFMTWLQETELGPAIDVRDDHMVFAPSLNPLPRGFEEEPLGRLSLRLVDEILKAGPEARKATILGTEVPGLLIVLAAPLTLMALVYYFVSHTTHIARLVETQADEMLGFAWLPITMGQWQVPWTNWRIPGHKAELLFSLVLLPVGALLALYIKLNQFGDVSVATSVLLGIAVVWIVTFAWFAGGVIDRIRKILWDPTPRANDTDDPAVARRE